LDQFWIDLGVNPRGFWDLGVQELLQKWVKKGVLGVDFDLQKPIFVTPGPPFWTEKTGFFGFSGFRHTGVQYVFCPFFSVTPILVHFWTPKNGVSKNGTKRAIREIGGRTDEISVFRTWIRHHPIP